MRDINLLLDNDTEVNFTFVNGRFNLIRIAE